MTRMRCFVGILWICWLSVALAYRIPWRFPSRSMYTVRSSIHKLFSSNAEYGSQSITVLEGLDPVRKRPGMYIGSTGSKGLHHLVYEVVDNSVDESLAGHCNQVGITLHPDNSVTVRDNGRGIPCEIHPVTGKSSLETVLCVLHAGSKFGGESSGYTVSGGLHGVGVSVVNALSESLNVTVTRDGKCYDMRFEKGVPVSSLHAITANPKSTRGTTIRFKPDATIFKTEQIFDAETLSKRFDELAYLNPGLELTLVDERKQSKPTDASTFTFRHEGGIVELVNELCKNKKNLHPSVPVITVQSNIKGVGVEVAFRWNEDSYAPELVSSFANNIRTGDGGSHVDGMKSAISKTVNQFARKNNKLKDSSASIAGEHIREGLVAVVSVKLPEPEFEGQTKSRLGNPEIRAIVDACVTDGLIKLFEWNPTIVNSIITKALEAQAAATAARAARDMVRRKTVLVNTVLPGKLADCSSNDANVCEIFIVEGDSAAGSAKQGRNRENQAILPLRGKILNIEKAAASKIYQNKELQALISALGLGVKGSEFDPSQLRYKRIVIMTDADVDGAHIRLLLLTFLYRYQPQLVSGGYVYVACPPLYKVASRGGEPKYLYDQEAFDQYMATLPTNAHPQIQRFKGLGEMMPTQLWDTTMNPSSRLLKLVTVHDAAAADKLFVELMGDDVSPRKELITSRAKSVDKTELDY